MLAARPSGRDDGIDGEGRKNRLGLSQGSVSGSLFSGVFGTRWHVLQCSRSSTYYPSPSPRPSLFPQQLQPSHRTHPRPRPPLARARDRATAGPLPVSFFILHPSASVSRTDRQDASCPHAAVLFLGPHRSSRLGPHSLRHCRPCSPRSRRP